MNGTDEVAILDACVLYPSDLRDLLLNLAYSGLYIPRWTREILQERERALRKRRSDLTETQISSTTIKMNQIFYRALVDVDRTLIETLTLPDMNDVHVLAGAMTCDASVIVTFNLKDFPERILSQYGIQSEHPDRFCERLIDKDRDLGKNVFLKQVAPLKRPAKSANEILDSLASLGMHNTARLLRSLLH